MSELGVDILAENSLKDPWCLTNPVPLKEKGQVLEILQDGSWCLVFSGSHGKPLPQVVLPMH
jgi:hypothetical protein